MKISEGIRLGTQNKTQIKDAWYDNKNGVCAIGALMLLPTASANVYNDFPVLKETIDGEPLINHIVRKNNSGSFEDVVQWLESIGQ